MPISWFSQPSGGYSSYYQYDPNTRHFVRIRLELGRTSSSGRSTSTFSRYKATRSVGFSDKSLSTSDKSKWSIENDKMVFEGEALATTPQEGWRVYDATNPAEFVHRGNAITEEPVLPEGIEPKHLMLIGNESMATGDNYTFTSSTASGAELSASLKAKVCEIVGVDEFSQVSDAKILETLQAQARKIASGSTEQHKQTVDSKLDEVAQELESVTEKLGAGEITPNQSFEEAFTALQDAVAKAKSATGEGDVSEAVKELASAKASMDTALENMSEAMGASIQSSMENSSRALEAATESSSSWEQIEADYSKLSETETIDAYEEELGIGGEEEIALAV